LNLTWRHDNVVFVVLGVKPRLNIVDILKPAEDIIEVQATEPVAGEWPQLITQFIPSACVLLC